MNTSHTPLWHIHKKYDSDIVNLEGQIIARALTVPMGTVAQRDSTTQCAAHIVRCVNAHDDLLAALKEALPYLDELYKLNTYAGVVALKMRAAIAAFPCGRT